MSNIDSRTNKRKLGDIGENIACEFLKKHGFEIVERNYLRKWGELDIVASRKGRIHFIEVKSVSGVTIQDSYGYRPEENMHPRKLQRLGRVIQTYLLHRKLGCDPVSDGVNWQLDLITVKMDMSKRTARVELIENIIV